MSAWKYVVLRTGNRLVPVIFPGELVHSRMAAAMKTYFASIAVEMSNGALSESALDNLIKQIDVVSAGEATLEVGACSGRSETLGIGSRPEDRVLINSLPYTGGYEPETRPDYIVCSCNAKLCVGNVAGHVKLRCPQCQTVHHLHGEWPK